MDLSEVLQELEALVDLVVVAVLGVNCEQLLAVGIL